MVENILLLRPLKKKKRCMEMFPVIFIDKVAIES